MEQIQPLDLIFGLFLLIMAYRGFIRGLIQELTYLAAMVLAIIMSRHFSTDLAQCSFMIASIKNDSLRSLLSTLSIFAGAYLVLNIILNIIFHNMRRSIGFFDKVLGSLLGIIEGVAIVLVIFLVIDMLVGVTRQPTILKKSWVRNFTYPLERYIYDNFSQLKGQPLPPLSQPLSPKTKTLNNFIELDD